MQIVSIDQEIVCYTVTRGVIGYTSRKELIRRFGPSAVKRINEFELSEAARPQEGETDYQKEQSVEEKIKEALTDE